MSPSATIIAIRPQLVAQGGSPDQRDTPEKQVALHPVGLRFPADAAEKLARTPVVHDLLDGRLTVPGAPSLEDRRLDCERAADFVAACSRDRCLFSSPEQAAHALLIQHRSVAASLALAHAVVNLLEPAADIRK